MRLDLHVECLGHVLRHAAVRVQLVAQHVMSKRDRAVLEDSLRVFLFLDVERVR